MKKINIMPQVVVYRDILSDSDIEFLLSQIHNSQKDIENFDKTDPVESVFNDYHGPQPMRKKNHLIRTWTPWYTFGLRSIWGDPSDALRDNQEEIKGFNIIKNAIVEAHFDYLNDWKDYGKWTYDITDWDVLAEERDDASNMFLSEFEILQHKLNLEEDYTIGVHTDWHDHRKDEPGPKQIITYTIYLNDDYKGGEIDFVDEENSKVFVYKPKKGDITVFPAGRPFWHGAKSVKSNPSKIFLRSFSIYRSPGSKEWNYGVKSHGVAKWTRIQNEQIKDVVESGEIGRQLVYKGQSLNKSKGLLPIYVDSEVYIDGRDI